MSDLSFNAATRQRPSTWLPETERQRPAPRSLLGTVLMVGLVGLVHAALFLFLLSQSHKAPIILANTEPPASVRVTMVQAPPPPPVLETPPAAAPQILTAERAERRVAPPPPEPAPPPAVPAPPSKPAPAKPKPKPQPKPVPPKPAPPAPAPSETPAPPQPARPGPVANASAGEKLMALSTSGPKDVQTIGCRVPAPDYPRSALRQRLEGVVMVQLTLDTQGQVQRAVIARSSGSEILDQAALAAISRASCNPYVENGQALSVRAIQPVSFSLKR